MTAGCITAGTPVAHARVQIRRRGEGGKLSLVTLSQEDGAYLFESLPEVAGYQIGAKAAKHRKASAVAVDLSVDPETRDVDLVLTPRG